MPNLYWTPERKELLQSLDAAGMSGEGMAKHFPEMTARKIWKALAKWRVADPNYIPSALAWLDSEVEILKTMAAQGCSGSHIAAQLGKTRNAILGKIDRLRAGGHLPTSTPAMANERLKRRRPRRGHPVVRDIPKASHPPHPPAPEVVREPLMLDGVPFTVRTIKDGHCRFPYGDPTDKSFHFCGHLCGHETYCVAHRRICFVPLSAHRRDAA